VVTLDGRFRNSCRRCKLISERIRHALRIVSVWGSELSVKGGCVREEQKSLCAVLTALIKSNQELDKTNPWTRLLFDKLTVPKLVEKYPEFHTTTGLISMLPC
jgi:hypothetical protein